MTIFKPLVVAAVVMVGGAVELRASAVPPHMILIVGDDVGWNDVSWHNRPSTIQYNSAPKVSSRALLSQIIITLSFNLLLALNKKQLNNNDTKFSGRCRRLIWSIWEGKAGFSTRATPIRCAHRRGQLGLIFLLFLQKQFS